MESLEPRCVYHSLILIILPSLFCVVNIFLQKFKNYLHANSFFLIFLILPQKMFKKLLRWNVKIDTIIVYFNLPKREKIERFFDIVLKLTFFIVLNSKFPRKIWKLHSITINRWIYKISNVVNVLCFVSGLKRWSWSKRFFWRRSKFC